MKNIWKKGSSILAFAISVLFLSSADAQQSQNLADRFNFSLRTLDDTSETFDTLIRSRNGLLVYGCVRKPKGKGPFPGVVLIHGGLGGNLGGTRSTALKSTPADMLVRNGYAILSTDYRAKDWVNAYEDILSALDFFRQLEYINPNALAILGGSHGGKLALEVVARVNLQAVVSCSGLYDLASLYQHCLTSEFHQRPTRGGRKRPSQVFIQEIVQQLGGTPEQVPEVYQRNSLISRAGDIDTPLLIVHGEQDASVPVNWSKELVSALKDQGKHVEAHYTEKGPHGFYWGSSAQGNYGVKYDAGENEIFLKRLLAFLDRHLKVERE